MVMGGRCLTIFFRAIFFRAIFFRTVFFRMLLCGGLATLIASALGCNRAVPTPVNEPLVIVPTSAAQTAVEPNNATPQNASASETATDNADELFKAMRAATAARSFRAKVEAEVDGEKNGFELEFAAPNRYRMKGPSFEFVIIGQEGYLKIDNQWQKAQRDEADTSNTFNIGNAPVFWGDAAIPKLKPHLKIKSVGTTALSGQPARLIEYEMTDALGHKGSNWSRTWVGADGLPRRTEMTGEYDGLKSKAVMTWLDYGSNLKIETPPVQ
jgi:hypothetical protein